jgi:hypothetical protein
MSLLDGLDDCAAYIAATPLRLVGYFGPTEKSPILAIPLYFLFPFAACFIPSLGKKWPGSSSAGSISAEGDWKGK